MNHRHLLPNEIDLLLDGEAGFGVAPLRAHVAECADCRTRLAEGEEIAAMLEGLPHFAPSASLADRVMVEVPLFVPWHVAARDTALELARSWMPESRPLRVFAAAGATVMAGLLTVATLWLLTETDLLLAGAGVATDRMATLISGAAREVALGVLGPEALAAIQQAGMTGLALTAAGFLLTAGLTWAGLRRVAATSHSHRG